MKNKIISFSALILCILLSSCKDKTTPKNDAEQNDSSLVSVSTLKDSTIYGISDEFGMSTFCLITTDGDTLDLMRDAEDGSAAQIFGNVESEVRYALTTRDNGQTVGTLINLDQLEQFVKDYRLFNGHLILHSETQPDTVDLMEMNDARLRVKYKDGRVEDLIAAN